MELYKYVVPARIDTLRDLRIRYTQPAAFNDPFELRPYLKHMGEKSNVDELLKDKIGEIVEKTHSEMSNEMQGLFSKETLEIVLKRNQDQLVDWAHEQLSTATPSIRAQLNEMMTKSFGILSLSEIADDQLMWAHYAQCHEGFVLGLDSEHPSFNEQKSPSDELRYLRMVRYQKNCPQYSPLNASGVDLFLIKSIQWEYEKEWRIIRDLSDAEEILKSQPYSICLFNIQPKVIKKIII